MNKRILQTSAFLLIISFTACTNASEKNSEEHKSMKAGNDMQAMEHQQNENPIMHAKHNSLADNFAHNDIIILNEVYRPDSITISGLEQVVDAYLQIKNALFQDDVATANGAVGLMADKVTSIGSEKFSGKGLEAWNNHQVLYLSKLKEMQHVNGLIENRSYFSHLSEIMYCTVKSFGIEQGNLYAIYCPMAFDNTGAYWINKSKIIQNPYFGSMMPSCGEIKEKL